MKHAMRGLVVAAMLTGAAFADAPRGHYRMSVEPGSWLPVNGPTKERVPSCGRRARDFIANIGVWRVDIDEVLLVEGRAWRPFAVPFTSWSAAVDDQLLEGFVLQIAVHRGRAGANGLLIVTRLGDVVTRCGDALRLAGRYRR